MKQGNLLEFAPEIDSPRAFAHRDAGPGELQGRAVARLTSGQKRKRILDALEGAGADGLTDWELHLKTKIEMSSINSCRNSLVGDGLVEKAPFRRRSPKNVMVTCWRHTGEEWADSVRAS